MIVIDTNMTRELVRAAREANNTITNAAQLLNSITVHNDWCCKERTALNEYTIRNKTSAQELQENAYAFLQALQDVAGQYDNTETGISDLFSSVEGLLSHFLNAVAPIAIPITPPPLDEIFHNITSQVLENVTQILGTPTPIFNNAFDTFTFQNLLQPVSITSFNGLQEPLTGTIGSVLDTMIR